MKVVKAMTDKEELIRLNRIMRIKQAIFEGAGLQNTANLTVEQQVDLDIRYETAKANYHKAKKEYDDALHDTLFPYEPSR